MRVERRALASSPLLRRRLLNPEGALCGTRSSGHAGDGSDDCGDADDTDDADDNDNDNDGTIGSWAGRDQVTIRFDTISQLDGFAVALRCLVGCHVHGPDTSAVTGADRRRLLIHGAEVTGRNMLPVYGSLCTLEVDSLRQLVEAFIIARLDVDMLCAAMHVAACHGQTSLLAACFLWLKTQNNVMATKGSAAAMCDRAAGDFKNVEKVKKKRGRWRRGSNRGKMEKAKDAVLLRKPTAKLLYDPLSRQLCYKSQPGVDVSLFDAIIRAEKEEKREFFHPGNLRRSGDGAEGSGGHNADVAPGDTGDANKDEATEDKAEGGGGEGGEEGELPNFVDYRPVQRKRGKGFPGMIYAYVERVRGTGPAGKCTDYILRHEYDDALMLVCRGEVKGGTRFLFSRTELPRDASFERHAKGYLADLSCNFLGTTFVLWDFGAAPDELLPEAFPLAQRRDHLAVVYDTNILGRVPNAMTVIVPRPEHAAALASEDGGPSIMRRHNKRLGGVRILRTKKPKWNDELEAWTMDFKGRVKVASKKNYICEDEDETILMLFGKAAKHRFSLDYRSPITALQAMSIALTSFADKLVVT